MGRRAVSVSPSTPIGARTADLLDEADAHRTPSLCRWPNSGPRPAWDAPSPSPTERTDEENGEPMRTVSISDRYEATEGTVLLSGIEALVRLLLTQRHLDRSRNLSTALFISGYEGSPLGGLDQQLQRAHALLSEADIVFSPGLNEELAATAVGGTQLTGELPGRRVDGVVGFWYGKNPGLDRAADAIRHANMSGTATPRRRRGARRGRPHVQVLDAAQLV